MKKIAVVPRKKAAAAASALSLATAQHSNIPYYLCTMLSCERLLSAVKEKKCEKSRTTNKAEARSISRKGRKKNRKSHQNHSDDLQQNCLTHLKMCVCARVCKVSAQKNAQSQHKLVVSSFSTEFNTHTLQNA